MKISKKHGVTGLLYVQLWAHVLMYNELHDFTFSYTVENAAFSKLPRNNRYLGRVQGNTDTISQATRNLGSKLYK